MIDNYYKRKVERERGRQMRRRRADALYLTSVAG